MSVFSRSYVNARAASSLKKFITDELGLSILTFATVARVPASTLRYFLNNTSEGSAARRHKRGPYQQSKLRLLLNLNLPQELRAHLLDAIDYDDRIVKTRLSIYHNADSVLSTVI